MPKTKISEFDVDPANNTDINSINIAEGCAPSGINNAIRQLMSDLKEFQTGAGGDPFNGAVNGTVGATTPASGTFTTVTANTSMSTDTISEKTSAAGVTVDGVLLKDNAVSASSGFTQNSTFNSASTMGFKNRIINGAMMIDQRNAGASVTISNTAYTLDRWITYGSAASKFSVQQNAGSVTPPSGFSNYLGVTSLSSYSVTSSDLFYVQQRIEGFNTADLAWGTANAQTVTLSFWVRSSLTGTFGGVLLNGSNTRSYPFTYTISSANTWEQKFITVAGETTGTWLTTNGMGIKLSFSLGAGSTWSGAANAWGSTEVYAPTGATSVVGTNGATFYITGVQLEKGSTATSFDYRPYGTELALCQRYYEKSYNIDIVPATGSNPAGTIVWQSNGNGNSLASHPVQFKMQKRATPTITVYNGFSGASGDFDILTVGNQAGEAYYVGQQGFSFRTTAAASTNQRYGANFVASSEL